MLTNLLIVLVACKGQPPVIPEPPQVVSTVPANGAVDVSVQTSVRWVYDQALDESTLGDAVVWEPPIDGVVSWEVDKNTLVFTPNEYLSTGTVYMVTVGPEAESIDGRPAEPTRIEFTTATGLPNGSGPGGASWTDGKHTTDVVVTDADSLTRTYDLETDHPQRDGGPSTRTFSELEGQMVLRSGHDLFDALFALSVEEARQAQVDEISDGGFRYGSPTDCACYETGELWSYVWTRDTAYAADLGLAALDASRARRSLEFKLSADKAGLGGGLQIVQDTGTGGSWPVSTDRVVWALGASAVLNWTTGAERDDFRDLALQAAVNTIEIDRVHVYDAVSGLYRGEQSFLDWREQTYPSWTSYDVRHIAESQSLSTNVGHWALLDLASRLSSEVGDSASASRYGDWASQLKTDIDEQLWLSDDSGYATMIPNQLDPAPLHRLDWLGTSLAALHIAPSDHAIQALSSYPQAVWGPPVIWPQQPRVPIYHNRAIWPFVTAYGVRAGVAHQQDAVVSRGVRSLARGSAFNLSNMENLEFLTGDNWVDDGDLSGPVVNSRRQLWSVAGYLGMVLDILGVQAKDDGLHISPYLPQAVRREWTNDNEIALRNVVWKGVRFDLELQLPAVDALASGALVADQVTVDGVATGQVLSLSDLSDGSVVSVIMVADNAQPSALSEVVDTEYTQIFSPFEPTVSLRRDGDNLVLDLDASGELGTVFDIWRDGVQVAVDVPAGTWIDSNSAARDANSYCYAVAQRFVTSNNSGQRSSPQCWWGDQNERITTLDAHAWVPSGGLWDSGVSASVAPYWWSWGDDETATVFGLRPEWTGPHLLQIVHSNGSGAISTGITAAHKWLEIYDESGALVAEGGVVLPQSADWDAWRDSTGLVVSLQAGRDYQVVLSNSLNMSRLDHFSEYTAGLGGGAQPYNAANLASLKVLPLSGTDSRPSTGALAVFDGVDDLSDLPVSDVVTPGALLQPWARFGLSWDADWLYIVWVSQAFEDPWAPAVLYLEAIGGPASPSGGMDYSGQNPNLPFSATHAITARNTSDPGGGEAPWDGVYRKQGNTWLPVRRVARGVDSFLAADVHTLSMRVPRSVLEGAGTVRIAGHVVNAVPGQEWVHTIPASHTPWAPGGGGYYQVDLDGPTGTSGWLEQ